MYAVFKTGGKQYRVGPGDRLRVEKLAGGVGDVIAFDQVLLVRGDVAEAGEATAEPTEVTADAGGATAEPGGASANARGVTVNAGLLKLGRPLVQGARVEAKIVGQGLGPKVVIFKFRRRKNYRRKTGHRQPFTALEITGIVS